jgi:hypothetical protein
MNSDLLIELSFHEIYMAACIGVARRLASLKRNETNKVQNKDFGWHTDIEAACAELAVAKFLNIHWDGSINTFKKPDLSNSLQIRHTQLINGCLILRNQDCPHSKYVLVTGTHPQYKIAGYINGKDGMQDKFLRDPGGNYPAWFVPQDYLKPLNQKTCLTSE